MATASILCSAFLEMTNCRTAAIKRRIETKKKVPKKKYAIDDVLDPSRTRTMPTPIHAIRMSGIGFLVTAI